MSINISFRKAIEADVSEIAQLNSVPRNEGMKRQEILLHYTYFLCLNLSILQGHCTRKGRTQLLCESNLTNRESRHI